MERQERGIIHPVMYIVFQQFAKLMEPYVEDIKQKRKQAAVKEAQASVSHINLKTSSPAVISPVQ